MLNICSSHHTPITFDSGDCPLCAEITLRREAQDHCDHLKETADMWAKWAARQVTKVNIPQNPNEWPTTQ